MKNTTEKPLCTWQLELTDTFGGGANYSWVRREEITLPEGASNWQIIRAAKKYFGLSGLPTKNANFGDSFSRDFAPAGICQILFITLKDR